MFIGDFLFGDLVYNWDTIPESFDKPVTILKFSPDSFLKIPIRLIFEPAIIIKGFNFLIEGDNYVSTAGFIYTINNSLYSVETEYEILLSNEQIERFKIANHIDFSAWFEIPDTDQYFNNFEVNQPIKISIVFSCKIYCQYD